MPIQRVIFHHFSEKEFFYEREKLVMKIKFPILDNKMMK